MKYTLFALALTPVLLTGCGGSSSSDHDISKAINEGLNSSDNNIQQIIDHTDASTSQKSKDSISVPTHEKQTSEEVVKPKISYQSSKYTKPLYNISQNKQKTHEETVSLAKKKPETPARNKWIAAHPQITAVFQDAGFTADDIYDLCKTDDKELAFAISSCKTSVVTDNGQSLIAYTIQSGDYLTKMTYIPIQQKLVIDKLYDVTTNKLSLANELRLNGTNGKIYSSSNINVSLPKSGDIYGTVTTTLYMSDPIIEKLKDEYTNTKSSLPINLLEYVNKASDIHISLTADMGKVDKNQNDIRTLDYHLGQIITIAGQ
ncbi:hypothetical protein [Vibrio neonatus]|uniref:hypothetical protein n=1 Tax=Vibrio neonatus TaxID=278860 RepID=UPI0021C4BC5C|nr:hypothetical protein [Vibrio neonatus]